MYYFEIKKLWYEHACIFNSTIRNIGTCLCTTTNRMSSRMCIRVRVCLYLTSTGLSFISSFFFDLSRDLKVNNISLMYYHLATIPTMVYYYLSFRLSMSPNLLLNLAEHSFESEAKTMYSLGPLYGSKARGNLALFGTRAKKVPNFRSGACLLYTSPSPRD